MRALRLLWAVLLVALALFLGASPRPVEAHAAFLRSEPAPDSVLAEAPETITVWFTEPLEPAFSEVRLLDGSGAQVDNGDSAVRADDPMAVTVSLPALPDGVYTVAWRNLSSVDGHSLEGAFTIVVGDAPAEMGAMQPAGGEASGPELPEAFMRGLILFGSLALAGGLAFANLVIRPVLLTGDGAGTRRPAGARLLRASRLLLWLAWLALAVGSAGQLVLQTAELLNVSPGELALDDMVGLVRDTTWGHIWLWRALAAIVLSVTMDAPLAAPKPAREGDEAASSSVTAMVALVAAAGLLLTLSLSSHAAASGELRLPALFSDYLHLLAASLWVGGLFHFALSAGLLRTALPAGERGAVLAAMVPRFSTIALLSTGTLAITGLYASWVQVNLPAALMAPYGLTLLGKMALLLPMLALGAVNLLRLGPRLAGDDGAGRGLGRSVRLEAMLGVALLLATGLLTSLEPARQVAARTGLGQAQRFRQTVERTTIVFGVEPGYPGRNRLMVELTDAVGRPVSNATEVSLALNYLDAAMAEVPVMAQPAGEGRYVAEDVVLNLAGNWQASLLVRRPDAFDARAEFYFALKHVGSAEPLPQSTGYLLWGVELALLGLLFLTVSLLPQRRWWRRPGLSVAVAGGLALLAGVGLILWTAA